MYTKPQLIKGKEETSAYLAVLNTELANGLLILLPTDNFHQETEDYSVNRRYLDLRTGEIFQIKGSIGGPFNRYNLERVQMRAKAILENSVTMINGPLQIELVIS
jgi:hypothetical protein